MHILVVQILVCAIFIKDINTSTVNNTNIQALRSSRSMLNEYKKMRTNLLQEEYKLSLGGKLQLNRDEKLVNNILMKLKNQEFEMWFHNPDQFNFSRKYLSYRNEIENSQIYQIIRRMPKGAALHVHSTLTMGAEYLLNLTYEDNLYVCQTKADMNFIFASAPPSQGCANRWTLLSDLRSAGEQENIDRKILNLFTMTFDQRHSENINVVWGKFNRIYHSIKSLITFRPMREKFIYDMLQAFYDDNVMYIEIRTGIHKLYELDGTEHDGIYMVKLYEQVTERFKAQNPDFIGFKLILTRHRSVDLDQVRKSLEVARVLQTEVPHLFAGFDLVGQEDLGRPLNDFLPALYEAKNEMNFYFHSGETNWFGMPSDDNLLDAILLGTKRIGHAYSLAKHPMLMRLVIQNNIALEVNVISNQVLALVSDVRNHPLATYLALDLPVVLSSDDPGVWGADPLSHDFFVAFLGIASRRADLRMLKQLALNSITYSALNESEKQLLMNVFNRRWKNFLKEVKDATQHLSAVTFF